MNSPRKLLPIRTLDDVNAEGSNPMVDGEYYYTWFGRLRWSSAQIDLR